MKKIWIIAVCVLVALLLAAGAVWWFFLRTPERRIESEDEASLYPYFYQTTRDGWRMTITGDFPEGYAWGASVAGGDADAVSVSAKSSKDPAHKAVFLIEPKTAGGTVDLLFRLAEDAGDGAGTRLYEIAVQLRVTEKGDLQLLRNYSRAIEGAFTIEGAHFTATLTPREDGSLSLVLHDPRGSEWVTEARGNAVSAGPTGTTGDGDSVFTLGFLSLGQSLVRLHNVTERDESLELYLTTDLLGQVRLVEAKVTASTYSETESPEDLLERHAAAIDLPAGVTILEKKTIEWQLPAAPDSSEEPATVFVALLALSIDDTKWLLYITDELELSRLAADVTSTVKETGTVPGTSYSATTYVYADGTAAVWEDTHGFRFLFKGATFDLDLMAATVQTLLDVNR